MTSHERSLTVALVMLSLTPSLSAHAQDRAAYADEPAPDTPAPRLHVDLEVDPTAYAFSGHSLHVGLGYGRFRADFGNFAMDIPSFLERNDGFEASAGGFGLKLQVFPFAEQQGPFAGIEASLIELRVQHLASRLADSQWQLNAGLQLGWRIPVVAGFFVTPWLGLGHPFGASDVTLDGDRYEMQGLTVFPAIHLGYVADPLE